ncbi:MAG: DUF126 domain-containing protein [Atopococcus tabaci]|uniref:DUF126 domain-containing protein n=1 Tax=Atopococcus tabaci TaxID=269774 RepID=A0AA43ZSN5_9LACT|nr:DUF126 domain-containing protein [Atopococcus tabaci]
MPQLKMHALVDGEIHGKSFCLQAPLSLWDGIDSQTGTIIQVGHPDRGKSISGKILIFSNGMSGATAGAALTETVRTGSSPLAMILPEPDAIVVTASVTAGLLYDKNIPVFDVNADLIKKIPSQTECQIKSQTISWQ